MRRSSTRASHGAVGGNFGGIALPTRLAFALLLLISTTAASDDLPVIGPCDVALEQMEAVLVARVDGITLEEYAESHSAEMMVVATAIYQAKDPATEIQRRYEECLREQ